MRGSTELADTMEAEGGSTLVETLGGLDADSPRNKVLVALVKHGHPSTMQALIHKRTI